MIESYKHLVINKYEDIFNLYFIIPIETKYRLLTMENNKKHPYETLFKKLAVKINWRKNIISYAITWKSV